MKKEYQQPQVKKVVFVDCSQIICQSGDNKSRAKVESEKWSGWDEDEAQ